MAGVYTKKGDQGETGLLGGSRISKDSLKVSCYGTLDEANAALGVAYSLVTDKEIKETIRKIQKQLFVVGAEIASDDKGKELLKNTVDQRDIDEMERKIDEIEQRLGPLKEFIIPGDSTPSASIHVARTIVRRAERLLVEFSKEHEVRSILLKYLNRLSDTLFMLARLEAHHHFTEIVKKKVMEQLGIEEKKEAVLGLSLGKKMADAVEAEAIAMGIPVVFSVVDTGGNLVLVHRMEDALLASLDIAVNKAYTSVALKMPTHEVAPLVQPGQPLYGLEGTNGNRIVPFGGGFPLKVNNQIVGGIGVSGGTVEEDMTIAEAALQVFEQERRS